MTYVIKTLKNILEYCTTDATSLLWVYHYSTATAGFLQSQSSKRLSSDRLVISYKLVEHFFKFPLQKYMDVALVSPLTHMNCFYPTFKRGGRDPV